jgi:hypothetical protein
VQYLCVFLPVAFQFVNIGQASFRKNRLKDSFYLVLLHLKMDFLKAEIARKKRQLEEKKILV